MTPELKDKLRGYQAFTVETPFIFVPKVFRENLPKEQWPLFLLRSKNGTEVAKLEDTLVSREISNGADGADNTSIRINSGSNRLSTIEIGLLRVKNLPTETGEMLQYDKKLGTLTVGQKKLTNISSPLKAIEYFPAKLQVELQNAINERSTLSEEELRGLEF